MDGSSTGEEIAIIHPQLLCLETKDEILTAQITSFF